MVADKFLKTLNSSHLRKDLIGRLLEFQSESFIIGYHANRRLNGCFSVFIAIPPLISIAKLALQQELEPLRPYSQNHILQSAAGLRNHRFRRSFESNGNKQLFHLFKTLPTREDENLGITSPFILIRPSDALAITPPRRANGRYPSRPTFFKGQP